MDNSNVTNPQGQTITTSSFCLWLSLGFLMLILTLLTYFCTCRRPRRHPAAATTSPATTTAMEDTERAAGIDEATLLRYPKLLYSQAKLHQHHRSSAAAAAGCSICLADYKDADVLRLLPECGHVFHITCVDPWLRLNPTCPICRNSSVLMNCPATPVGDCSTGKNHVSLEVQNTA